MAEKAETMVRDPQPEVHPAAAPLPATERDLRWKRFRSSNPRLRLFLIIGAVVVLVAVFFLWRYLTSYEDTDDAQIDGHLNSISARVSGQVVKLLVEDNQYVQAVTPLVQIDPKDYEVAMDRAKADYADAVALADAARVNVPITSVNTGSQVSAAQADVENAQHGIAAARQQYTGTGATDGGRSQQRQGAGRPGTLQTTGRQTGDFAATVRPGFGRRQGECCRRGCGPRCRLSRGTAGGTSTEPAATGAGESRALPIRPRNRSLPFARMPSRRRPRRISRWRPSTKPS